MHYDVRGRPIEVGDTVRRVPDHHTYRVTMVHPMGLGTVRDDGQPTWLGTAVHVELDPGTPRPVGGVGDVAQALLDALPPGPVRDLVAERGRRGLITYGRPLSAYGDGLDTWRDLLRPEAGDMINYLTRRLADTMRGRRVLGDDAHDAIDAIRALLRLIDRDSARDTARAVYAVAEAFSGAQPTTPTCPACDDVGDDPTCPTCGMPTW